MGKHEKIQKKFLSIADTTQFTGLGPNKLRALFDEGVLEGYTTSSGQRRFNIESLQEFCNLSKRDEREESQKINYIYARVSSKKQLDDLERQIEFLRDWTANKGTEYHVIKDIGSGINFKRAGLNTILDRALRGLIGEVVVAHRDRLCRFGFELVQSVVEKSGGKITVINDSRNTSSEQELAEDLLAIVHIYSCRQMGKRSYRRREASVNEITESKDIFNTVTEEKD